MVTKHDNKTKKKQYDMVLTQCYLHGFRGICTWIEQPKHELHGDRALIFVVDLNPFVYFLKWQPQFITHMDYLFSTSCGPHTWKRSHKLQSKSRHMHIRARNRTPLVVFPMWVCCGCGNPPYQTLKYH